MYQVQPKPDKEAMLYNGSKVTPLVTLKDEYGGISHIIEDDHCYVLINKTTKLGRFENSPLVFAMVNHWYTEAVEALKKLPAPKPA